MKRAMTGRLGALVAGLGASLLPAVALAAEPVHGGSGFEAAGRSLETGADTGTVVWVTLLSLGGLFIVTVIGYAYRQKRALHWRFQQPDAPHDEHH